MAATTLSGFLQCNFLSMDTPMQSYFEALCKTSVSKKKRGHGNIKDTLPPASTEPQLSKCNSENVMVT